jgi:hypothetical protein
VYSLLLTVILAGIGAGSLLSRASARGQRPLLLERPAERLIAVQGLFVAATLIGLAAADASSLEAIVAGDPAFLAAAGRTVDAADSPSFRVVRELWFNARPMLIEVGVPALLMGFAFPPGNAIVQRAEESVGRRAGVLYLANTCGAVCGSLVTGFILLPHLGIQTSATILMIAASVAVFPLFDAEYRNPRTAGHDRVRTCRYSVSAAAMVAAGIALALWLTPAGGLPQYACAAAPQERAAARGQ